MWRTVAATGRTETYFLSTGKQKHWIIILRQTFDSSPAEDEQLWKLWASHKHIYTSWPCCSWSISFIKKKRKKKNDLFQATKLNSYWSTCLSNMEVLMNPYERPSVRTLSVYAHIWLGALLGSGEDELLENHSFAVSQRGEGQIQKASMSRHKGTDSPSRDRVLHRTSFVSPLLEQQCAHSSAVQCANNGDGCFLTARPRRREETRSNRSFKKTCSRGSKATWTENSVMPSTVAL